jgi:putative NIF3 family GTP cyclohydrolase 1 type 2
MDPRGGAVLDAVLTKRENTMRSLSRRQFALMAGAGLTAGNLAPARQGKLTAGEVVERIKKNIGVPWNDSTYRDTFKIGGPDSAVAGICSSFEANLSVLQKAVKAGLNMFINHEPTFWTDGDIIERVQDDPLYKFKLDWAKRNNLVVWRLHDHIHSRKPDGIWLGWNEALGWTSYQVEGNDRRWDLPPTTLGEVAKFLAKKLSTRSIRVIGDPNLRVVKVASGRNLSSMAQTVDCIIASDSREYDTFEYARDAVFAGTARGMIYISHEAAEDVGMDWFAKWLTPFVPEVPVRYIPTGDDFWMV